MYPEALHKIRNVPMPTSGYVVPEQEIDHRPVAKRRFLDLREVKKYMSIVGNFIWIQGIRMDIIFAVLPVCYRKLHPDSGAVYAKSSA